MPTYPTYQTDQTTQLPTIDEILAARYGTAGGRYARARNLIEGRPDQAGGGNVPGQVVSGGSPVGSPGDHGPTVGRGGGGRGGKGGTKQQIRRQTFDQLLDLLQRHGATDPLILNREIQGIYRGTEANTNSIQEALGAQGYSSGVGQALVGASRAAGTEAISGARAREAAAQEQRQRQNLLLTLELLINPKLQRRGQDIQKYIATHRNREGTDFGGLLGPLGSLLKIFGVGGGSGGGKKDAYSNDYGQFVQDRSNADSDYTDTFNQSDTDYYNNYGGGLG